MKTCVCCNAEVENNVKFCPYCGKSAFKNLTAEKRESVNYVSAPRNRQYQSSSVGISKGAIWSILIGVGAILLIYLALSSNKCSYCGDKITGEAVTAGGRDYCSYNCYMSDFFSGK